MNTSIRGWMSEEELMWLESEAKKHSSICEVGSWAGRSAYSLLENCKGTVTCADNWSEIPGFETATKDEFLSNVGHFNNLIVIEGNSSEVPDKLGKFDMVFLDASHEYDNVKRDIEAWLPKVNRVICGHDYDMESVKRAVDESFKIDGVIGSIWYKYISL